MKTSAFTEKIYTAKKMATAAGSYAPAVLDTSWTNVNGETRANFGPTSG